VFFEAVNFNSDEILELPSDEFKLVSGQIDTFLKPSSKVLFDQYGYIYKRSILMHGVPGTGKTILANRIANKVVSKGGIVLFNPNPQLLPKAYRALTDIEPDTKIVVIFEELDQLVKNYEEDLLTLLDGEIQKPNIIYIATTNYISKVPARIMRPGRFGSVVQIEYPNADSRRFYLNSKIGKLDTVETVEDIVKKTDGFSIDEVKEVILSHKCLLMPLDEVVARIKKTKELCVNDNTFDEYVEDPYYQPPSLRGRDIAHQIQELSKNFRRN
jgi:SpoVK/Ycf46/Vps4 family AAA+-type ATPase